MFPDLPLGALHSYISVEYNVQDVSVVVVLSSDMSNHIVVRGAGRVEEVESEVQLRVSDLCYVIFSFHSRASASASSIPLVCPHVTVDTIHTPPLPFRLRTLFSKMASVQGGTHDLHSLPQILRTQRTREDLQIAPAPADSRALWGAAATTAHDNTDGLVQPLVAESLHAHSSVCIRLQQERVQLQRHKIPPFRVLSANQMPRLWTPSGGVCLGRRSKLEEEEEGGDNPRTHGRIRAAGRAARSRCLVTMESVSLRGLHSAGEPLERRV
ncbi:unnamed protein product [Pleuronectes platessa]|uniref:Uncharacterized protein n=1 Tax=Pleuronectes platessa TaxID=8262 RepID=A0A9N7UE97_PLEPL|nr:unnamed protein product [Pleuronectes platessa]